MTCETIVDGPNARRCGQPAAYRDGRGGGWCLRHGADLIRSFGADDFEPLTPEAGQFVAAFKLNGYGPVGTVWPDAPDEEGPA